MKVLLCSDGSRQAALAARFLARLVRNSQTEITLLGIAEHPGDKNALGDALRQTQAILAEQGLLARTEIEEGEPISRIVSRTRKTNYNLIVIGAVRKRFDAAYAMSRKAYRIIKLVQPPVLVVIGNPQACSRILLCSSGRPVFENAVQLTGMLARSAGASVLLLHVFAEPPAIYSSLRREDEEWLRQSKSRSADTIRRQMGILEKEGVDLRVRLRFGSATDQILEEVEAGGHDMLVVGSNPTGSAITSYLLGNVTRELINNVSRPILVTRAGAEEIRLMRRLKTMLRGREELVL